MRQFKSIIIFLYFAFTVSINAESQNILQLTETNRIDSIINQLMKKYKITGSSIAIVDNNQIAYAKGYGYADRKNKIAATENTIYSIGSITKTFTALAIMKLSEEGKIDLNKSAKDYLPELKITSIAENGDILKIKNILTHTSGLPDDIKNGDLCSESINFWTVIEELNKQVLTLPANWAMCYSNIGYDLLGCIIERVSGKRYEDYISENILSKLSMNHTGFELKSDDAFYSKGYMKDSTETEEPKLREVPAGGLFSNVTDMSKFMLLLLNNDGRKNNDLLVSVSALQNMKSNHLEGVRLNIDNKFGYGLFIERMYNLEDSITGEGFGHPGDTYVYHSTMFVFPKMNIGFIVFSNSEKGQSFCNTALKKLFREYVQKVKGIQLHDATNLSWSPKAMNNNISDYNELTGTYGIGSQEFIRIKNKSFKKLFLFQGRYKIKLKMENDNTRSYKATLLLLKIIPIKIKGVRFLFEKIDNRIYLKQLDDKLKTADYVAVKDIPAQISQNWKNVIGKYKVINACKGNLQGVPTELKIVGNKIILVLKFSNGEINNYSFDQISDTIAATDGINRGSGMIMKILPNRNLYFSGYEMTKE